jgi:hypothetical protein
VLAGQRERTSPAPISKGRIGNLQIIAVAKDDGWYALVFRSGLWASDESKYFAPLRVGFGFGDPEKKPATSSRAH